MCSTIWLSTMSLIRSTRTQRYDNQTWFVIEFTNGWVQWYPLHVFDMLCAFPYLLNIFWARYESPALTKDDWMESSWWDGHYRCTLWRTPDGGGHTERTGSIAPLQAPSSSSLPHHGYIFFCQDVQL